MWLWCQLLTVPVQSVRLTSKDLDNTQAVVYADAQPVVFNEGELRHLYCDVLGGFPEPHVSIFIGDLDVTSRFTKIVQLVRDTGSRDLFYHVTLANDAFSVGSVTFYCILEIQESRRIDKHLSQSKLNNYLLLFDIINGTWGSHHPSWTLRLMHGFNKPLTFRCNVLTVADTSTTTKLCDV